MNIITECLDATSGEVLVDGHNVLDEPLEARRCIGYLPEQLCAIQGTQRVELGAAGEEILSVKLEKAEGESQMLTFYACDVDSYLLPVTKTHGMLVPAQDVDRLLRILRQQG